MKNLMAILFLLFISMLNGCSFAPSQKELENADYGQYPSSYKSIISEYMSNILKDPSSAEYRYINTPKTGWNSWGGTKFGYIVCTYINAKNSFGGYNGAKLYYFFIKNNQVILEHGGDGDFSQAAAQGSCKSVL